VGDGSPRYNIGQIIEHQANQKRRRTYQLGELLLALHCTMHRSAVKLVSSTAERGTSLRESQLAPPVAIGTLIFQIIAVIQNRKPGRGQGVTGNGDPRGPW